MAASRISGLPSKAVPIGADSIEIVDSTGPSEARATVRSIRGMTINVQLDDYTPVVADATAIISMGKVSATTLTLPNNVFALGDTVTVIQWLNGQVTFAAASGAFVVKDAAYNLKTRAQYAVVQAILVNDNFLGGGEDVWLLVGGLELVP